jgi:hypothetical protein
MKEDVHLLTIQRRRYLTTIYLSILVVPRVYLCTSDMSGYFSSSLGDLWCKLQSKAALYSTLEQIGFLRSSWIFSCTVVILYVNQYLT